MGIRQMARTTGSTLDSPGSSRVDSGSLVARPSGPEPLKIFMKRHVLLLLGLALTSIPMAAQESQRLYPAANVVVGSTQPAFETLQDRDGDGDLDSVGALFGGTNSNLGLWENDGAGRFALRWTGTGPGMSNGQGGELLAADFDGDGRDDFVMTSYFFVAPYIVNGFNAPTPLTVLVTGAIPNTRIEKVKVRDIDGDGLDDLVVLTQTSLGLVLSNLGGTPQMNLLALPLASRTMTLIRHASGDFTALLSGNQSVQTVGISNGGATLTLGGTQPLPGTTPGMLLPMLTSGDLDGDGDEDAVAFGETSFHVMRQNGSGQLNVEAPQVGGPATNLADVDNDGDLDGVCCGGGGGSGPPLPNLTRASNFEIAINDGTGNFAPAFQIAGYGAAHIAGAADIDADGDVDLVGGRAIFFSKGPLSADPLYRFPSGSSSVYTDWSYVDVDGDGDVDPGSNLRALLRNDGSGSLTEMTPTATGAPAGEIQGIADGDFDGDGDLDCVVQFGYPLPISAQGIYLATQTAPGQYTVGGLIMSPGPNALAPNYSFRSYGEDLSGDGLVDLIVTTELPTGTSTSIDRTSVYWGQSGGSFAAPINYDFTLKGTSDFDGDGIKDLVIATTANGFGWVRNLGAGAFSPPAWLGVPTTNSRSDRIAIADLDSDGDMDILAPSHPGTAGSWKTIVFVRNDGNGMFTAGPGPFGNVGGYANASPTTFVRVSDLDHNGVLDVMVYPAQDTLNSTAIFLADAPMVFRPRSVHVVVAEQVADLNGDGALDIVRAAYPASLRLLCDPVPGMPPGAYDQYGMAATVGSPAFPILGAKGPFRSGETVRVILRGGVGGSLAILAISTGRLASPIAWPQSHSLYLDAASPSTLLLPVQLGGAVGVPDAGTATLDFAIPPGFSGVELHHQAAVADPNNPTGISLSNAFHILYGG